MELSPTELLMGKRLRTQLIISFDDWPIPNSTANVDIPFPFMVNSNLSLQPSSHVLVPSIFHHSTCVHKLITQLSLFRLLGESVIN